MGEIYNRAPGPPVLLGPEEVFSRVSADGSETR